MYPLEFPTYLIRNLSYRLVRIQGVNTSVFTGHQEVFDHGHYWEGELTLKALNKSEAFLFQSFLLKLKGLLGSFTMAFKDKEVPLGEANRTPIINSFISDTKLEVSNLLANQTLLKSGDMLGFSNGEYKMLVEDLTADAQGVALATIEPGLRVYPGLGSSIDINPAKGVFRLSNQVDFVVSNAMHYSFSMSFREVIA
ncbi:MAG: hypothetical protein KC646_10265 [Candidatus Cloacimonetes bacterium]|nr:hypothetical protein [Candidatus Cloacimonadota bacterium]